MPEDGQPAVMWEPGPAPEPHPVAPAPRVRRKAAAPRRQPRGLAEVVAVLAEQLSETNATLLRLSQEVTQIASWMQALMRDRRHADDAVAERFDTIGAQVVDAAERLRLAGELNTAHVLRQGETLKLGIDAVVPALDAAVNERILAKGEANLSELLSVVSHELTSVYEDAAHERAALAAQLSGIESELSSLAIVVSRLGRAFRALDLASAPAGSAPKTAKKSAPTATPTRTRQPRGAVT